MHRIWHETFLPLGKPTRSPALPGSNGVCGLALPGTGMAFADGPRFGRWRSRCAERGLRQADCVAARPAAGCSSLQSFICFGLASPQVRPGMSSAGLEARRAGTDGIHSVVSGRRGSGEVRFMVGGGGGQRPIMWVSWDVNLHANMPLLRA